jgi:hypothetical protein
MVFQKSNVTAASMGKPYQKAGTAKPARGAVRQRSRVIEGAWLRVAW